MADIYSASYTGKSQGTYGETRKFRAHAQYTTGYNATTYTVTVSQTSMQRVAGGGCYATSAVSVYVNTAATTSGAIYEHAKKPT